MTKLSDQYEKLYPGTGCSEAQAHERMERINFKEERSSARRTSRNRGIIVPSLPWRAEDKEEVQ